MILPSRSTTQMCVSFIEMSKPAKYSMAAPPIEISRADSIGSTESSRPITPCCKSILQTVAGNIDLPQSASSQLRFVAHALVIQFLRPAYPPPTFATQSAKRRRLDAGAAVIGDSQLARPRTPRGSPLSGLDRQTWTTSD